MPTVLAFVTAQINTVCCVLMLLCTLTRQEQSVVDDGVHSNKARTKVKTVCLTGSMKS